MPKTLRAEGAGRCNKLGLGGRGQHILSQNWGGDDILTSYGWYSKISFEFVNGTINLINAAKKKKVKQFIFASSEWVYGNTINNSEQEENDKKKEVE